MDSGKLVSIIIPMYNAEKTLQRCIDSVCAQTYQNIEVILVNDGSEDGTAKLCIQNKKKDSRIILVNKQNGGLASARNAGLEVCSGEYIFFVDCDDYIERDTIYETVRFCEQHDLDLVIFGIQIEYVDENYSTHNRFNQNSFAYEEKSVGRIIFESCINGMLYSSCNKLYSMNVIKKEGLLFELNEEPIEDILFNCKYLQSIDKVGVREEMFYHYVKEQKESEVTKYRKNLWRQSEKRSASIRELYEYWNMNKGQYKLWLDEEYIGGKADCISNLYRKGSNVSNSEKRQAVARYILNNDKFKEACENIKGLPLHYDKKVLLWISKLHSVEISIYIYNVLFWIRYRFQKLYLMIRKQINRE